VPGPIEARALGSVVELDEAIDRLDAHRSGHHDRALDQRATETKATKARIDDGHPPQHGATERVILHGEEPDQRDLGLEQEHIDWTQRGVLLLAREGYPCLVEGTGE
jgi:hypothetical protein